MSYLYITDSTAFVGKVVGETNAKQYAGNGLTDPNIKDVIIPRKYEGINIVEIGRYAFHNKNINSIFIPRTIIRISCAAFESCQYLTIVKFEVVSILTELDQYAFYFCNSIKKIDFPPSLTKIGTYSLNGPSLECFSYSGLTFIDSLSSFFSVDPLILHASKNYPQSTFAGRTVTKDDLTCIINNVQCTKCNRKTTSHYFYYVLLLIYS